jgi:hypothetical protein
MSLKASQVKSVTFGRHAGRLTHYGYDCIPVASKRPAMDDWTKGCPRDQWERYADYSLGILTERTPAIDVDVLDEDLARKIQDCSRAGPWRRAAMASRTLAKATDPVSTRRRAVRQAPGYMAWSRRSDA